MEVWKDILDYKGLYQVSNIGRVKGLERKVKQPSGGYRILKERVLKASPDGNGYLKLVLYVNGINKTRTVHQLVAEAFLNYKPCGHKLVPNHINFDKQDNHVVNIEIVTQRKNTNKKHLKSSSKYTGICWHKGAKKWMSRIYINGKDKHLGYFTSELDASNAYQKELLTLNE